MGGGGGATVFFLSELSDRYRQLRIAKSGLNVKDGGKGRVAAMDDDYDAEMLPAIVDGFYSGMEMNGMYA